MRLVGQPDFLQCPQLQTCFSYNAKGSMTVGKQCGRVMVMCRSVSFEGWHGPGLHSRDPTEAQIVVLKAVQGI